jgi:tetratricopeptide (TPR) repeat protein
LLPNFWQEQKLKQAEREWQEAKNAVQEGQFELAQKKLDFCLSVWPADPEVHLLAARVARLTGDIRGAETHLENCQKLQQGATEAIQLEYLLMRAQTGEEEEVADALFALVDRKHRESALIMETLARAFMHHLRFGLAYDCLTRWIREAPRTAKAYYWRGWVLERLNNHHEAMDDYKRALKLAPDLIPIRLRVAELLMDEHLPKEAAPHLELLRKQAPKRADVMARLGQCRFLQGRAKEARSLLEKARKQLPDDPQLLLHLGKLDLEEGKPDRAEKWLRRALIGDPSDTETQYTLVRSLQLQGRKEAAKIALGDYQKHKALVERANQLLVNEAKHPTKDPTPASDIGILLLGSGQERLGLYWLDQALIRDPNHKQTHKALADYFEKKGQRDRAAPHRRWLARNGRRSTR